MKKYALLFISIAFALFSQAQGYNPSEAPYKKDSHLPEFRILKADSTWFTDQLIPQDKPVIIMYFNPDCEHCQKEAEVLVRNREILDSAFLLLASYDSPEDIGHFVKRYKLDQFRYMAAGRDADYYLPTFFKVEKTPFIAVYSRYHRFVKAFTDGAYPEELSQLIK